MHRTQRQGAEILTERDHCAQQRGGIRAAAQGHNKAAGFSGNGSVERRVQGRGNTQTWLLALAERAECAQARLARIEQLCDRLVAHFGQVFDDALLHRFRHQLRIAMRSAVRFLQDLID